MTTSLRGPPTVGNVLQQNRQKYYDGLVAVVLFFVWQLLICGLQQITASIDDFPAPILAMILVAAVMILVSKFVANLDGLYQRYLRSPTDLLNRHMSIGFTVPFTMIMNGPMSSSRNIGLIIAGYIVTGILNTVLVFALSLGLQTALMSIGKTNDIFSNVQGNSSNRHGDNVSPLDLAPPIIPAVRVDSYSSLGGPLARMASRQPVQALPQSSTLGLPANQDRIQSYVSKSITLTNNPSVHSSSETDVERAISPLGQSPLFSSQNISSDSEKGAPPQQGSFLLKRLACFAAASPILCCSLVCIPLVGLPVSLCAHNDTALDTFLLVFLWTGTLSTQAAVRRTTFTFWISSSENRSRARSVLATLLNAVLWSSLGTIAYLAAKAASRHQSIDDALSHFSTGANLADIIAGTSTTALGAGDLASAVLDAGIVSWGLKLFECRAQFLSRAGLTTLVVGAVFAVGNVVCGPLLVHAMGLVSEGKQLAFAARSVTLALAGPAMTNLGGDVGLNAAMVVFNGIVFQVAMGLGVCRWASRVLASTKRCSEEHRRADTPESASSSGFRCRMGSGCWRSQSESTTESDTESESDVDVQVPRLSPEEEAVLTDRSPSSASTASTASSSTPFKNTFQDVEKTAGKSLVSPVTGRRPLSYSKCGDACFVHMRGGSGDIDSLESDTSGTVAAGMTVGINAAAMGTAYLYEDGSRAAPYAALSMTVFGVMTVVFTSIQPLAGWVVAHVG
ncbi:hypothetical protein SEUCBS139899_010102 [Sporothrix eucalyptigena]|uniref:LrgB-like protein n=1 Tax=Sporothrix eucalyptigena TaxID=1812306 RepID=A0ABP0CJ66_9PEZI